jgi:hypothetical protein
MVTRMKMAALWDNALCSVVEVDRRFRGTYWLIALMMEAVHSSETSTYFNGATSQAAVIFNASLLPS